MKQITFSARDLKAAITRAGNAISTNTVLAVLEDVKFTIRKDKATITATDLETTIVTELPCISMEDCVFLVGYKDLNELLKKVNSGAEVVFYRDEQKNTVKVVIEKIPEFSWSTDPVDDYPIIPTGDTVQSLTLNAEQFLKTRLATTFCSADTLRPAMTGVCFHIKDGNIQFVSTDAHRLYRSGPIAIPGAPDNMFVVPCKPIKAIHNMNLTGVITIELSNNNSICFKADNTSVYIRLIDAIFPPYHTIIPEWTQYNSISSAALKNAVDIIYMAANKTTSQIIFSINENSGH